MSHLLLDALRVTLRSVCCSGLRVKRGKCRTEAALAKIRESEAARSAFRAETDSLL